MDTTTYRIEHAIYHYQRPGDGAQLWVHGDHMQDVFWMCGRQRPRARVGDVGRFVYNAQATGADYRYCPYGINLDRFLFVGPLCPRAWRGVTAVDLSQMTNRLELDADVVYRYRAVGAGEHMYNTAFWWCEKNALGLSHPRVFEEETIWSIVATLVDPPPYTPYIGDTLMIQADGEGGIIKGSMIAALEGRDRYRVSNYKDSRAYTGRMIWP